MVGLTHVVFRSLVKSYLPCEIKTLWPTEMLNSRRLPHERLGTTPQTIKADSENDLIPQILGNDELEIKNSIKKLEEWGAKAIDINMGCPVKKALVHNCGVALMGDSQYAKRITRFAVESSSLPVSVKIRAGLQNDPLFLSQFVEGLQEAGASWVCLHPRLAEQKRRGRADWQQIKFIKTFLKIPVVGNGDIQTCEDVFKMLNETGCDGVMIGRALTAKPWMFAKISKAVFPAIKIPVSLPESLEEEAYIYGEALKFFINESQKYFSEDQGLKRWRFFVKVSHPWLNFGHSLFAKSHKVSSYEQALEMLNTFFKAPGLKMSNYTDLKY